jgi:hypothetical protein
MGSATGYRPEWLTVGETVDLIAGRLCVSAAHALEQLARAVSEARVVNGQGRIIPGGAAQGVRIQFPERPRFLVSQRDTWRANPILGIAGSTIQMRVVRWGFPNGTWDPVQIRLLAADIDLLWPKVQTKRSAVRMTSNRRAEEKCGEWIAGLPSKPIRKRETVWKEAAGLFGSHLSERAFLRQWGINAPNEWREGGARPKKSAPNLRT